jgi:hypothetical protein
MAADCIFDIGNGLLLAKHPQTGLFVRSDGAVFVRVGGRSLNCHWTYGSYDVYGYLRVKTNGTMYKVHRLVAETFIPNPFGKTTVDHINQIRDDNSLENLRWATHKEQIENSACVQLRSNYGVREVDNPLLYKRTYNKQYYQKNKEHALAYRKQYYEEHKEGIIRKATEYKKKKKAGLASSLPKE